MSEKPEYTARYDLRVPAGAVNRILCPDCAKRLYPNGPEYLTCTHGCYAATCVECGKTRGRNDPEPNFYCLGEYDPKKLPPSALFTGKPSDFPPPPMSIDIPALRKLLTEGEEGKAWINGLVDQRVAELSEAAKAAVLSDVKSEKSKENDWLVVDVHLERAGETGGKP